MINVADLCVQNFSNFPRVVNIIQQDNRNFLKNPHCAYEFSVSCVYFGQKAKNNKFGLFSFQSFISGHFSFISTN